MKPEALAAYVDATAELIGLPVPADCREGVVRYFGLAEGMAALVMAHPLATEDEPGAIFVPVAPEDKR